MNNTTKSTSKTPVSEEHISFLRMCYFISYNKNIRVLNSPHTYGCSNSCGIFRFLRIQWMVNISFMSTKLHEKIRHKTSIHTHNSVSHNESIIFSQNNINILQYFRPSRKCWWRFKYSAMYALLTCTKLQMFQRDTDTKVTLTIHCCMFCSTRTLPSAQHSHSHWLRIQNSLNPPNVHISCHIHLSCT